MTMGLLQKSLFLTTFLLSTIILSGECASQKCVSTQFFYINTTSVIGCSFEGDYYALYWYNSIDPDSAAPFISYDKDNGKRGSGLSSGEFDLFANGSLVINSVSLDHEHQFRVLMLAEKYGGSPYIEIIDVHVLVRPKEESPVISGCEKEPICYRKVEPNTQLSCTVSDARPAVNLKLIARKAGIDKEIPSHTEITQNSALYSTNVTTTLTAEMFEGVSLVILLCQVNNSSLTFQKQESLLLVDYSGRDLFSMAPVIKKYVPYNDETVLLCPHGNLTFFVWKKKHTEDGDVVLFYDVFNDTMVKRHISHDFEVNGKGTLTIPHTALEHEGSYGCFTGDGVKEKVLVYDVLIYVLPSPNYPVVEGCNSDQHCVLEVEQTGTLTCTLHGIRPLVDVEWRVFPKSRSFITLSDKQVKITKNDVAFDISLTIHFRLSDGLQERITAECTAMESDSGLTGLATKLELIPATMNKTVSSTSTTSFYNQDDQNGNTVLIVIVAAIAAIVVIVIMTSLLVYLKVKKRRKTTGQPKGTDEEMRPVLNAENEAKFDDFKKQLKQKYERIYKSVQPIPYLRDKIYCVNDLFVKFGMKTLISKGENKESDKWKELQSYSDMSTITEEGMKRILIEGDPGYGKSTLMTQMVYDWCNSSPEWSFKNIDVLILLHLRQLRGDDSIYKAIKSFLLTKDATLTDSDIECILKEHASSVCFIFDGFDEYPLYTSKGETDVKDIIQGELFADSLVIITTRTNILPKKIAPQTVRIRLTGFDDSTRYEYIKKAIVGNDEEASQQIQERLKESPILGDLCEVPLFFAIFAHITHRGEEMETFTTVTSFFRFMIACFRKHMQNKQIDETEENKEKNDGDENIYCDLDELAFEGLHDKKQTIIWDKNDLHTRLGEKVYSEYSKIGILVEEEVVEFNMTSEMETLQNKTKVTFYHKIFCEWYAAKHLAKVAEKGSKNDIWKVLSQLDCNNLQYVYRFACGISVKAAERIVKFLDESDVSDQFTILCINEQKDMIENIKETVLSLCSNPIIFHASNDAFLQRSITQFLHIASKQKVTIESVWLRNVYQRYESQRSCLLLNHGVALNSLETLHQLHFYEEEKDFTVQEMSNILEFVETCGKLIELWFHLCLLPISLEGSNHLTFKQDAKLKVYWNPSTATKYTLNHSRGVWLDSSGKELTAMEYDRQRKKWLKVRQHQS